MSSKTGHKLLKHMIIALLAILISLSLNFNFIQNSQNSNISRNFASGTLQDNGSSVFQWNKTFGDELDDQAYSIVQTDDDGLIISGEITSYNSSDLWSERELSLIKLNEDGVTQWSETYGQKYSHVGGYTVIQSMDGGFASAGYITTNIHDDVFFIKTHNNGSLEWIQKYGSKDEERIYSVFQTAEGGYLLAGFTDSFHYIGDSVYLLKVDPLGNEEWHVCYGGASTYEFECVYSMIQTEDEGFVLAGYTSTYGTYPGQLGEEDVWLFKIDSNGIIQWNKTYGYQGIDRAFSLIETSEGDYVLAGYTTTSDQKEDIYVLKTDSNGILEWSNIHGGKEDDRAHSIIQDEEGNLVLTGYTDSIHSTRLGDVGNSESNNRDAIILKMDIAGKILWNYRIGGKKNDGMNSIIQTTDGNFVLAGYTESYGKGEQDIWLIKIEKENFEYSYGKSRNTPGLIFSISFPALMLIVLLLKYKRDNNIVG
ncbi:MAG: hypothetical protein ACW964_04885 [Candidatus Hodarchaeales archaeon]